MLEADEAARARGSEDAEARARKMRDRWRQYAAGGWCDDGALADDYIPTDSEDEEEAADSEWVTDEIREHRSAKEVERDAAVRTVLKARSLRDALGLPMNTPDAEAATRGRKLLQLLHPDFPINLSIKGSKKQLRIEAAFKKLNGLRAAAAV